MLNDAVLISKIEEEEKGIIKASDKEPLARAVIEAIGECVVFDNVESRSILFKVGDVVLYCVGTETEFEDGSVEMPPIQF